MPSISLAKAGPKEGSQEWFRAVAEQHSETNKPLQLEHRREHLSVLIVVLDRAIKEIQAAKKNARMAGEAQLRALADARAPEEKIAIARGEMEAQTLSFEIMIAQQTGTLAMVEAMCLIVDSLTIRMAKRNRRTGKRGLYRYTAARYMQDIGAVAIDMFPFLQAALKVDDSVMAKLTEDDDEEDDEIDDDEVLTDEEREAMRRKALDAKQDAEEKK